MTKIVLYSCLTIGLLGFACQKDVYYNIDPNTKMLFKKGDTLLFISTLRTDTFNISNIENGYNTSDKLYHKEYQNIYYRKLNNNIIEDSIFSFYSTFRGNNGMGIEWRNISETNGTYNKTDTTMKIGNLIIDSVNVLNDSSKTKHYLNDIRRIYYCNLYGVIEYDRYTGEKFILDSKCFSKYIK